VGGASLDGLGASVRLYDVTGDDLGVVHVPHPLVAGDVVARRIGPPLLVLKVVPLSDENTLDAWAEVAAERGRRGLDGR